MAFDAFLKIDGIVGETTDKTHPGEIQVDSFSWGVSNPATIGPGGGISSGRASLSSLNFLGPTSKAGPNLMLACATGKHLQSALLTCRTRGSNPIEFLKIRLTDVLVESYQQSGGAGGGPAFPEDSFSLFFVKIDDLYTVPSTGEVVEVSFDQSVTAG